MRQPSAELEALLEVMKQASAALREAGVEHMLGGALAAWARGGPESTKDLDFMIRPDDADAALAALGGIGMRTERPPEGWLVKAWDGPLLVDLIFEPKGMEVDDDTFARADIVSVRSMDVAVMALEDVLATKLLSLNEQYMPYDGVLAIARAVREQIDFDEVRRRTAASPFARAFFVIAEGLGIAPAGEDGVGAGAGDRAAARGD
jgi:hypothetical protein